MANFVGHINLKTNTGFGKKKGLILSQIPLRDISSMWESFIVTGFDLNQKNSDTDEHETD